MQRTRFTPRAGCSSIPVRGRLAWTIPGDPSFLLRKDNSVRCWSAMCRGWKEANLAKCVMLASGAEAEDIRYVVHHTSHGGD